jgi:GH25 family lysozyme M1 (1,4-beta-N-acetylmuramidase)
MLKKQIALFIAIGILLILIIISYNYSINNVVEPIYSHNERFSDYIVADGIDVSTYQGTDIDWDDVKHSGIDFVLIRASYRGSTTGEINDDDTFLDNIKGANAAGIMTGAYFFSQAITEREAREEAEHLIRLISDYEITMPLVIDCELIEGGRLYEAINSRELSTDDVTDINLAFCDIIKSAGYEPMVYGNMNFLRTSQDTLRLEESSLIWLAHYTEQTSYGGLYNFWQCSDQGTVPGINANVDKNFWYINTDSQALTSSIKFSTYDYTPTLKDDSFFYLGKAVEPKVECNTLIEGTDYIVSYIKNTSSGTGYAIVDGIGDYNGRSILDFEINSLF